MEFSQEGAITRVYNESCIPTVDRKYLLHVASRNELAFREPVEEDLVDLLLLKLISMDPDADSAGHEPFHRS